MRPRHLELCGINSFSRKAVIDFDALLSGGIFGIFGDTGSGKTTILDSIVFALYGKIDRTRGGLGSDIINYNCDKAQVLFDFEIETPKGRKIYRVEREIKRKNSMQSVALYELAAGRIIPVCEGVKSANPKIQEIIGLSFEDFKKCIALPQGEFAQFVKSERSDRLKLVARLFDLERYGELLNQRLKEKLDAAKSEVDLADGELRGYAAYTPEELAKLQAESAALKEQKEALDREYGRFAEAYEALKAQYARYKKYRDWKEEESALQQAKEKIERERACLLHLPAARELLSLRAKAESLAKSAAASEKTLAAARAAHGEAERQLLTLREQEAKGEEARIIEEKQALLVKIARARTEIASLSDTEKDILAAKAQLSAAQRRKEKAEDEIASCEKKANAIRAELEKAGEGDAEALLLGGFESALLQAEYRREDAYFREKLDALRRDFSGGELYDRVESELEDRIRYCQTLLTSEKTKDVGALLEQYRAEQVRMEKLRGDLSRVGEQREYARKAAQDSGEDLAQISQRLQELTARKQKVTESVCAAFSAEELPDFNRMAARAEEEREDALRAQKQLTARIAAQQDTLRRAEVAAEREKAALASCTAEKQSAELRMQELKELLPQSDRAEEIVASVSDERAVRAEIEEYDRRSAVLQANLQTLQSEGEVEKVPEENVVAEGEKLRALTQKKQSVSEQAAVHENEIASFSQKLQAKQALQAKREACAARLEVISKLRQLIRGNGLMEFVAEEYLSEISASASRNLLRLTSGRYFVRYKDGGFQVGDNFSGGEFRSVNTLSGGETFLVSLSLALALSEAIHAKSLRPIEFFFLDEGFGTLDEKLVDTVLDSLEKLKSDHFSIGLISHVEELKHRIGNKIIVTGAEATGSSEIQICH